MDDSTTLTRRLNVDDLVMVYEQSVADIRLCFETIDKAERRLNDTFGGEQMGRQIYLHQRHGRGWRFDDIDDVLDRLRRDVWSALVERLELRRMMSVEAWAKLSKQIEEGEMPEITHQSVASVVRGFQQQLPDMLTEAVREVFDFLRPRHWDRYRTNERHAKFELGKRVILERWVRQRYWGNGFEPNDFCRMDRSQRMTALENVFSALDGRGQITSDYKSDLEQALRETTDGTGETRYFNFRAFKKGTLHLTFKRPDLVKKLNQIAGGKTFREAA